MMSRFIAWFITSTFSARLAWLTSGSCVYDYNDGTGDDYYYNGACVDVATENCTNDDTCKFESDRCQVRGCKNYTEAACPTDKGCMVGNETCADSEPCKDLAEANCTAAYCVFKNGSCKYRGCADFTDATCPSWGCKTERDPCNDFAEANCTVEPCIFKSGSCKTKWCEDYSKATCPAGTAEICILKSGSCKTKHCEDYTNATCPTATVCKVDGETCTLPDPCKDLAEAKCTAETCIFKSGSCEAKLCEDFTNATCPTGTAEICILKSGSCKTKNCEDYTKATCPTATGCKVDGETCTVSTIKQKVTAAHACAGISLSWFFVIMTFYVAASHCRGSS